MAQHDDPDQHDVPRPTESQAIVANIKKAYEKMTPEEKRQLHAEAKGLNEMQRQDLLDEIELDLL